VVTYCEGIQLLQNEFGKMALYNERMQTKEAKTNTLPSSLCCLEMLYFLKPHKGNFAIG
jgi:hypothetical protein